jgi:hypothetical protein
MRLPLSVSSFAVKGNREAVPFMIINRATAPVTGLQAPNASTLQIQISLSELLNELLELISLHLLPKYKAKDGQMCEIATGKMPATTIEKSTNGGGKPNTT